jgi:hypothetical protein
MPLLVSRWMLLPVICVTLFVTGCSGSSQPVTTSGDEVTEYLNAHPELKEPKKEVPLSDPTKP